MDLRDTWNTPEPAPQARLRVLGFTGSRLLRTVLVVLLIDATLTALRGLDFVRYVFSESRFAVLAVVLWLGLSVVSLSLFRRFREWAAAGFPLPGRAFATVVYAYLLLALALGLTLEYLAGLVGVDWLETGGDEPNRIFTAVGLTITGVAVVMTVLTIRSITKMRANRLRSVPSSDARG